MRREREGKESKREGGGGKEIETDCNTIQYSPPSVLPF